MKLDRKPQHIVISGFSALFLSLFIAVFCHSIWADSQNWRDELLPQSQVHLEWGDGQKVDTAQMAHSLDGDLVQIQKNAWFAGRLPENWGALIDAQWTLSSGFYSDLLKTPQGFSAILFSPIALLDDTHAPALIAHELTHLMHEQFRSREESWVREGLAMMGEWKVTGFYSPVLEEAFVQPETSLIAPLDPRESNYARADIRSAQYGQILQYFMYIYRLCGKDTILEKLLTSKSSTSGIAFVDETLKNQNSNNPACQGFETSFRAFSLARAKQNFLNPDEYIVIAPYRSALREQALPLPPYSSSLYEKNPEKTCRSGDFQVDSSRCLEIRLQ